VEAPYFSPEGAFLTYASYESGRGVIWLRDWETGESTPVFEAAGQLGPGWIAGE